MKKISFPEVVTWISLPAISVTLSTCQLLPPFTVTECSLVTREIPALATGAMASGKFSRMAISSTANDGSVPWLLLLLVQLNANLIPGLLFAEAGSRRENSVHNPEGALHEAEIFAS